MFTDLALLCSTPQAMVRHLGPMEFDLFHRWRAEGLSPIEMGGLVDLFDELRSGLRTN